MKRVIFAGNFVATVFAMVLGGWGCGVEPQAENYGITEQSQIILTSSNHPHGFGQSQCFECHVPSNIHQGSAANLDLARALVEQSGIASCRGCHGDNGVSP